MKALLMLVAVAGLVEVAPLLSQPTPTPTLSPDRATVARPAPSAAASPNPSPTADAKVPPDAVSASGGQTAFDWSKEVAAPLIRFAGVALILYLLILGLNLKDVLLPGAWSERTIIALAIVLTFCSVLLLNVQGQVLTVAKDVALIVIGFYFGASKGSQEERPVQAVALEKGLKAPRT